MLLLKKKASEERVRVGVINLNVFYGRYDDLVSHCGKSVSQMTTDISRLSKSNPILSFRDLSPNLTWQIIVNMGNMTGVTREACELTYCPLY